MKELLFKYRGKIPLPLMAAVFIWHFFRPYPSERNDLIVPIGLAVSLSGEAIRIWAVGYAGASTRGIKAKAKQLVTGGPYAHVRNPIYIGNFMAALGVVLALGSWLVAAVLVFYFFVIYHLIVEHEESFLMKKFGEAYRAYSLKVPRFIPRLSPYHDRQGTFRWKELRKEHWSMLGLATAFLLTLLPLILHSASGILK